MDRETLLIALLSFNCGLAVAALIVAIAGLVTS